MRNHKIQAVVCLSLALSACNSKSAYQTVNEQSSSTTVTTPTPKTTSSPTPKASATPKPSVTPSPSPTPTPIAYTGYRWVEGTGCVSATSAIGFNELPLSVKSGTGEQVVTYLNSLSDAKCVRITKSSGAFNFQIPKFVGGLAFNGADFGSGAVFDQGSMSGSSMKWVNLPRSKFYKTSLRGVDLTRSNLHLAEMHEVDLSNATLSEAKFYTASTGSAERALLDRVNLTSAKLVASDVSYTQVSSSTLSSLVATSSRWHHSMISDSNLTSADFSSSAFFRMEFVRSNLKGVKLLSSTWNTDSLIQVELSGASFALASMNATVWTNVSNDAKSPASVAGVDFTGTSSTFATIIGMNIPGSKMAGTRWSQCDMTAMNVAGSSMNNSYWSDSKLRSGDFSGVTAQYSSWVNVKVGETSTVSFANASMRGAKFSGAIFYRANFQPSKGKTTDLERADFRNAILKDVDFEQVNLKYAVFENTDMYDSHNTFKNADLTGATYDYRTKLPKGWNDKEAQKRGMIKR